MEKFGLIKKSPKLVYNKDCTKPILSIIIVTYNSKEDIFNCIDSIQKSTCMPYEIIIVDNDSSDGTQNYLREVEKQYHIRIIFNSRNLGFSVSTNQGIKASHGEYLVLLNPDTIVTKDWAWHLMLHFSENIW